MSVLNLVASMNIIVRHRGAMHRSDYLINRKLAA